MADGTATAPLVPTSDRLSPLTEVVRQEFADDAGAISCVVAFLRRRAYDRQCCIDLLDVACDRVTRSWALRRLAILMLEHQILKLPEDDLDEFAFLFARLGIARDAGADGPFGFIRELRGRLERLNRVHAAICGLDTPPQALADFIHASRSDCKLTLARYLFTPEEVVERIVGQLKTSAGLTDMRALNQPGVRPEIDHCFAHLPPFEAAILSSLCSRSSIYWLSASTPTRINGLVECPLNTVVAVIKLPGSDLEFELKRVGVPGRQPLDVVFSRDGCEVPATHRLHGGSMAYYLRWEAGAAAGLAQIYRLIHRVEPPISRTLSVSIIFGVPVNGSEQHVVDYFTNFSDSPRRDEARRAMRESIEAFRRETRVVTPSCGGALGLATQFLGQVAPAQSILTGTTSFRLDRLAEYLSPDGARSYFERGLNVPFDRAQGKRFADELLEEALGMVAQGDATYENHGQYIDACMSHPSNRMRADRHYGSIMRQIGRFWGTLFGMRSYSYGESFVARNVGLKSRWEDGAWQVRLVFMDHDALYLTGKRSRHFHPMSAVAGIRGDAWHIWGHRDVQGQVELLREIFRVDRYVELEGCAAFRDELRAAYRKTHDAIRHDLQVQRCFLPEFVERFSDWDDIVIAYLKCGDDPAALAAWREEASDALREKAYPDDLRREYLNSVEEYAPFLREYSFLY